MQREAWNEGNPPTSLFEAAQRGMKMNTPKVSMAPPKTPKELAKQLVEAAYELPLVRSALNEAKMKLERIEAEIDRAKDTLEQIEFTETKVFLVTTPVCQKVVTLRKDDAVGVIVEVLDVEAE